MTALQHAKKMVLIDPRELDKVNAVVRDNDLPGNTVRGIDSDMKKILDRTDLSAFDKMQLYGQTLQRYLRMDTQRGKQSLNITLTSEGKKPPKKEEVVEEPTPQQPPPNDEILERELLETVPKSLQTKAKNLFNHLSHNRAEDVFDWTPGGEIIVSGNKVPGSNVVDLIYDSMKSRKGYENPTGWRSFSDALALTNTPESLITNAVRRAALRERKPTESGGNSTKSPGIKTRSRSNRKGKRRPSLSRLWENYWLS